VGQKTHPIGFRLGINKPWSSNWFATKEFPEFMAEDIRVRKYISKRLPNAGVSRVDIDRTSKNLTISIHTARPGIVIGRGGEEVDRLKEELTRLTGQKIQVNILEIKRPELDAKLVGENIAHQLIRKIAYRRAVKKSIQSTIRMGAEGIRIRVAGRLGGAEIARSETFREGKVPLHTLRSDIDFAITEAKTTYGIIGIKIWIYKGEIST
jgi:small subunit ribosomal protein S3|tara:strand:- start:1611 stop:2237 length:627 start_codon:yes stop_codon:yes gene_type:complete